MISIESNEKIGLQNVDFPILKCIIAGSDRLQLRGEATSSLE